MMLKQRLTYPEESNSNLNISPSHPKQNPECINEKLWNSNSECLLTRINELFRSLHLQS